MRTGQVKGRGTMACASQVEARGAITASQVEGRGATMTAATENEIPPRPSNLTRKLGCVV